MQWRGAPGPPWCETSLRGGCFLLLLLRPNKIRMIRGIGMPTNQRRMGMWFSFQALRELSGRSATPCAVAEAAAFGRGEAGAKRSNEQRRGQPERKLSGCFAGRIHISLRLCHDIIDALVGVCLAEAGSRSDYFRNICPVGRLQIAAIAQAGGKHANQFLRPGGGRCTRLL